MTKASSKRLMNLQPHPVIFFILLLLLQACASPTRYDATQTTVNTDVNLTPTDDGVIQRAQPVGNTPTNVRSGTVTLVTSAPQVGRLRLVTHTVQPGDTLYGIASAYGLRPETVLWSNYGVLRDNPDLMSVGMELVIPPSDGLITIAEEGDSIDALGRRFQVKAEDIVNEPLNRLTSTDQVLTPGQQLFIPGGQRETTSTIGQTVATTHYAVIEGDTLFNIATRFGLTVDAVLAANPSINPEIPLLTIGQVLVIPAPDKTQIAPALQAITAIPGTYIIQAGDTLMSIAERSGLTPDEIRAANPNVLLSDRPGVVFASNPNRVVRDWEPLRDGVVLYLPAPGTIQVPPTPTPTPVPPQTAVTYGYSLRIASIQDCALSEYNPVTPMPGDRTVQVDVVLANVSDYGHNLNVDPNVLLLIDTHGVAHAPRYYGCDTIQSLVPISLPMDTYTRGFVYFDLPSDAKAASIIYNLGKSGLDLRVAISPLR